MSAESGMGWISRDNIARSSLRVVAHGTIQPHTKDDCYRPSPVYRRELAAGNTQQLGSRCANMQGGVDPIPPVIGSMLVGEAIHWSMWVLLLRK